VNAWVEFTRRHGLAFSAFSLLAASVILLCVGLSLAAAEGAKRELVFVFSDGIVNNANTGRTAFAVTGTSSAGAGAATALAVTGQQRAHDACCSANFTASNGTRKTGECFSDASDAWGTCPSYGHFEFTVPETLPGPAFLHVELGLCPPAAVAPKRSVPMSLTRENQGAWALAPSAQCTAAYIREAETRLLSR
jgi:hypothetical protein